MNQLPIQEKPPIGFVVKPLPLWLKFPNTLAERLDITSPKLTPENLIKAASRNTSLSAIFPSYVEESLEVLCRSITDEAKLHWFGKMNYWNLITTGLSGFLEVEQAFREDPSLINTKLINPLIVVGLPRSGTSFLHRLLSVAENNKGIELYRFFYPVAQQPDFRSLKAFAIFEPWRIASGTYNMDAIHYMRPKLPDECNFGLRLTMQSMIFWATSPIYSYFHWLLEQNLQESYSFYRKVLILFQKQLPEKRLTLKCPYHVAWLPNLVKAIPEAGIVQIHREPLETIASHCKLTLSVHSLATDSINWKKTVDHVYFQMDTYGKRAVEFANSDQKERIFHVKYSSLIENPENLVRQIYQFLGTSLSNDDLEKLNQYVANNKQHKHGINRYSLEQFGLSPQQVIRTFGNYRDKFL